MGAENSPDVDKVEVNSYFLRTTKCERGAELVRTEASGEEEGKGVILLQEL